MEVPGDRLAERPFEWWRGRLPEDCYGESVSIKILDWGGGRSSVGRTDWPALPSRRVAS
jgi:hypothetical protein